MVAQLAFEDAVATTVVEVAPQERAAKPRVVVHLEQQVTQQVTVVEVAPIDVTEAAATGTLTKVRIVERIIEMNPTASEQFLRVFSHRRLMDYMEHLASAQEPRGRNSSWLRRGDSPAIVAREPREE